MKFAKIFTAAVLAVAASASFADSVTTAIDLSDGNARFGRDNAIGSFTDIYTFTLANTSYLLSATASTAASGPQDLDCSSLVIEDAANSVVATFAGNLANNATEFYALSGTLLVAGDYRLIIRGISSPMQASYSGNCRSRQRRFRSPKHTRCCSPGLARWGSWHGAARPDRQAAR